MKVLTIVVPVYNTEKYLKRCLDSIVVSEVIEDIEILIINDGSKDNSLKIAREYEKRYPNSIIAVDKENGGHGSTINRGLEMATGKYFRVLDSDDWFNIPDFLRFVKRLKNEDADAVITNYRKEFVYNSTSELIAWNKLKADKLYLFDELDMSMLDNEYFVMANTTYKTEVLLKANLKLFEKTFYVDMQYNIVPILCVESFIYYDLDIYRYFIGRPEQSMNLQNFVKNRANHTKVVKFLIEYYNSCSSSLSKNKKEYIELILYYTITTQYYIYCVYAKSGLKNIYREIKEFDLYLKEANISLYKRMNQIGQIKYNRKTAFIFTRLFPQLFSKAIAFFGKIF